MLLVFVVTGFDVTVGVVALSGPLLLVGVSVVVVFLAIPIVFVLDV